MGEKFLWSPARTNVGARSHSLLTAGNRNVYSHFSPREMAGRPPRTVLCCLCGRGFGTASIAIHSKSCQTRWLREEGEKPAHLRRPLPDTLFDDSPSTPDGSGSRRQSGGSGGAFSDAGLEERNAKAALIYSEHSLSECEHCGRRFLAEKLVIHQRSCTRGSPARRGAWHRVPGQ